MNIAIYCGSSFGNDPVFKSHAKSLIQSLNKKNATIVYGGSESGIMGTISNEALSLNMQVLGVITHDLINKEILNSNITKIYKVNTMRDRKAKMEELADAFIGFPGGFGTFEELGEVFTSIQIGSHCKPCALYNLNGYFDKLIEFLQSCVNQGFIKQTHLDAIILSDDIEYIYTSFLNYKSPKNKWELS